MAHLFIASKSLTDDLIIIITAIFPSDDEPRHFIVAWNNGKGYAKPSSDQLEIHFKNVLMSPFKSKKLYQLLLFIYLFFLRMTLDYILRRDHHFLEMMMLKGGRKWKWEREGEQKNGEKRMGKYKGCGCIAVIMMIVQIPLLIKESTTA